MAMVSQMWGGLCGCRSDKWRGGVIHHGAGSTDGFLIPGCLTPWVLQQHLTCVAAGSQPPWRGWLTSRGLSALQGLSALWALISEGTAARFGVAHAVQVSWDTALSMLGVKMEGGRGVLPSEGCSGNKVPGHLWQCV